MNEKEIMHRYNDLIRIGNFLFVVGFFFYLGLVLPIEHRMSYQIIILLVSCYTFLLVSWGIFYRAKQLIERS